MKLYFDWIYGKIKLTNYATFVVAVVSLQNFETKQKAKRTTFPGIPPTREQESPPPTPIHCSVYL
jgi:hypothetical protein